MKSFGVMTGVTFGDILASEVFSEKVTFPFRALKSDMIVFLAMRLSFGHCNHVGYRYYRNHDAGDDAGWVAYDGISAKLRHIRVIKKKKPQSLKSPRLSCGRSSSPEQT